MSTWGQEFIWPDYGGPDRWEFFPGQGRGCIHSIPKSLLCGILWWNLAWKVDAAKRNAIWWGKMRCSGGKVRWNHILCITRRANLCGPLLWTQSGLFVWTKFSWEICIDKCLWGLHKGRSLVTLWSSVSFRTHIGKQIKAKQLKLFHSDWLSYFNWPLHLW